MCPIYFDTDGNVTFPSIEPTNNAGFCMDGPDVLESFDFDSFLRSTDEAQPFDNIDFSFVANELDESYVTDNHHLPSAPVTSKTVPNEMENLRQSCKTLGQEYLGQIVTIHNVCKKTACLSYPDVLQSQLLTASRTLNKLGDLAVQHHEVVLETSLITALEALVFECQCGLSRISKEEGFAESAQALSVRRTSIKSSELIAYGCLVPLMNMLRAFTWWGLIHWYNDGHTG